VADLVCLSRWRSQRIFSLLFLELKTHGSLIFREVLKNLRKGWNKWLERTPAKPALVAEGQKEQ